MHCWTKLQFGLKRLLCGERKNCAVVLHLYYVWSLLNLFIHPQKNSRLVLIGLCLFNMGRIGNRCKLWQPSVVTFLHHLHRSSQGLSNRRLAHTMRFHWDLRADVAIKKSLLNWFFRGQIQSWPQVTKLTFLLAQYHHLGVNLSLFPRNSDLTG